MPKTIRQNKDLSSLTCDELIEGYQNYSWNHLHGAFGYGSDVFPEFDWILSLEKQFGEIRKNKLSKFPQSAFVELLAWGQRREVTDPGKAIGHLYGNFSVTTTQNTLINCLNSVIAEIENPENAIRNAMRFKGISFVFATKLLRFLEPNIYGAFDRVICSGFYPNIKPIGSKHEAKEDVFRRVWPIYKFFLETLRNHQETLSNSKRPESVLCRGKSPSGWRIADIEMAVFQIAKNKAHN